MKIFSYLYEWCIKLAKHRYATWFLCINSYIESVFWPIPPDVMLAPMCLARRKRAFRYALVTVTSSVAGAFCGYYLGYYLYDPFIKNFIAFMHYQAAMETVQQWLTVSYGIAMIFVGAFTPIPYKVIAITCGLVAAQSVASTGSAGMLNIVVFLLVSFVGRGLRFFAIAGLIYWGGRRMEHLIAKYIDTAGWLCVCALILYILYKILI